MKINCGSCQSTHATVAEVRDCHTAALDAPSFPNRPKRLPSDKQMSLAQALGRERVRLEKYDDLGQVEYEKVIGDFDSRQISTFIDLMLKQKYNDGEIVDLHPEIPAGRYALQRDDGDVLFYHLKDADERRPRRLYLLRGAPGDFAYMPLYRPSKILSSIAEDIEGSFQLFGQKVGVCGMCGSPLTNDVSREYGIGPDCRKKLQ